MLYGWEAFVAYLNTYKRFTKADGTFNRLEQSIKEQLCGPPAAALKAELRARAILNEYCLKPLQVTVMSVDSAFDDRLQNFYALFYKKLQEWEENPDKLFNGDRTLIENQVTKPKDPKQAKRLATNEERKVNQALEYVHSAEHFPEGSEKATEAMLQAALTQGVPKFFQHAEEHLEGEKGWIWRASKEDKIKYSSASADIIAMPVADPAEPADLEPVILTDGHRDISTATEFL